MNHYTRAIWASYLATFLLAIAITYIAKIIFTPLLSDQQAQLTQTLRLHEMPLLIDQFGLQQLIKQDRFDYIRVTNPQLAQPLVYENTPIFALTRLLFNIPAIVVASQNSQQLIEIKVKNSQLLGPVQKTLVVIYIVLIVSSTFINSLFHRRFKNIEAILTEQTSLQNTKNEQLQRVLNEKQKRIMSLTQQTNMDNLTGFDNRKAFRKKLTAILSSQSEQKHAIIFIIRASELMSINARQGFQKGDLYLKNLAEVISNVTSEYQKISLYRINGSDFALIAAEMSISNAKRIAEALKVEFDQYQALHQLGSIAYNGISSIISGQLPEQVLARTDMALAKAQSEGVNSWIFQYHNDLDSLFGEKHWHQIVGDIIANKSLSLLHQPILAVHHEVKGYQEIFTRFMTNNDQTIPTESVFYIAQRIDMIVKLEQLIIEKVVTQCRNKKHKNSLWGINITNSTIQNSSFIVWLERLLLREPNVAALLVFEIKEELLDNNLIASKRIFDMLRRTGTRSAISSFGKGIGSFSLFKILKPDVVKIDSSLINNIERDSANQQFVRMIVDVGHRMGCRVIAEGVEHLEQKQILETMYVDGIQGFLIARPTALT